MGGYYRNFGIAPISPPNRTSVLCLKILEHTAVLSPIDGSLTKRNKNRELFLEQEKNKEQQRHLQIRDEAPCIGAFIDFETK